MEEKNSKNKSFVSGALILGIAGVLIKLMGMCFRLPLTNIIGDDGMGYYQTSYPIYNLLLSIATAGIPTAISRMVSERNALDRPGDANKVFKVSMFLMLGIGAVTSSIFIFGADYITGTLLNEPNAAWCMRAIGPALFVVPLMASFRGYFQGRQDMVPTAASQFFEQLFRVAIGLGLAILLLNKGNDMAAAGASFGASAGGLFGLLTILIIYLKKRGKIKAELAEAGEKGIATEKSGKILKAILAIAIPITIGSAVLPILNTVDTAMVKARLVAIGYSSDQARGLYGQLTGFASSIINFPQVLMQAVAISMVPVVASAFRRGERSFLHESIQLGLRYVLILSMPMAIGISVLAKPIMLMFYPMQKEAAISAAGCLSVLAIGIIFLGMTQNFTAVLQGIGKQWIPVRNLAIGGLFKIACTYFLTAIPALNIKGAALGTVIAYLVAAILNMIAVRKLTGAGFDISLSFIKPAVSAGVMGVVVFFAYRVINSFTGNLISTLLSVCAGAFVYVILVLKTRAITPEEIEGMPKGKTLVRLLRKVHLVK
ncbi:MAG: polysaccharide biosynthesis protein [Clostridia bacterium]|nr:polysaccharide biosynthesis protein [Clostridia bacterium]